MIKTQKKPACFKNRCAMQDIFQSPDSPRLNRLVHAFIVNEGFDDSPAYARMQEKHLIESGLMELPAQTLLRMKRILADYKNYLLKKERK